MPFRENELPSGENDTLREEERPSERTNFLQTERLRQRGRFLKKEISSKRKIPQKGDRVRQEVSSEGDLVGQEVSSEGDRVRQDVPS
jgi:hypothetical protein